MVKTAISLKALNTFGLDVTAQALYEPADVSTLRETLDRIAANDTPMLILGGGSNVLFTRDWPGSILRYGDSRLEVLDEMPDTVLIRVGAGRVWHDFVIETLARGWSGLENLSLIWGWVGAAPMQNIGAYGVEVRQMIETVEALELATGHVRRFTNAECQFGYRESVFKRALKGQYLITAVEFRLDKRFRPRLGYGALEATLARIGVSPEQATAPQVSEAVIAIRTSKLPDPLKVGNSGSFFKNPSVPDRQAESLLSQYPSLPIYPSSEEGHKKLAAGWLIEQAGWRGHRRGAVGVHADQALVLVHYGGGHGSDLWQLAQEVARSVEERFGVTLEPEVNVI